MLTRVLGLPYSRWYKKGAAIILLSLLGALVLPGCLPSAATPSQGGSVAPGTPAIYGYRIVQEYPHDPKAFTEGLVFRDGHLYEGTGLNGQSTLREVNLETGKILKLINLPEQYFGEGVTIYQDNVIQLTWQSHKGFVYDVHSFSLIKEFSYITEGWGLTTDGKSLIVSDGTSRLHFIDPQSYAETGSLEVYDGNSSVEQLNELEYIKGEIYANVWKTDRIAIISPDSGRVTGWIDLRGLLKADSSRQPVDVLNGIAYDSQNGRLFVTGKLWPTLFHIELLPGK